MSRHIVIGAVFIATVIAAVVFTATFVRAFFYAPDLEVRVPELEENAPAQRIPSEHEPARLIIPALQIDAAMQHVGVNAKGNMATPSNFTDVAWYKYGTVPGYIGSAVVAGHLDNALGLDGVFKRLGELKAGDDVFVETKEGKRLHFTVTAVAAYHYKDVPLERIFNHADMPRLNLITCAGSWVKSDRTYDQRMVVYTQLVQSS